MAGAGAGIGAVAQLLSTLTEALTKTTPQPGMPSLKVGGAGGGLPAPSSAQTKTAGSTGTGFLDLLKLLGSRQRQPPQQSGINPHTGQMIVGKSGILGGGV